MPPAHFKLIDPSIRAFHDATLPTREERRENLNNLAIPCANFEECGKTKPRSELKVCAKCKLARYCSQACQKSHWRAIHKAQCSPAGEGSPQALPIKLAERALAAPVILDAMFNISVLVLDLITDPTNAERAVVKVACQTLAADIQAYMRRMFAGLPKDPGAQVCLSYASFTSVPLAEVDEKTRQTAADMRVKLGAQISDEQPLVTFWFVKAPDEKEHSESDEDEKEEEGSSKDKTGETEEAAPKDEKAGTKKAIESTSLPEYSLSVTLRLPKGTIAYMATKPKEIVRSTMLADQEVEKTERNMRELLNNTIRMDTSNKLRLRAYPTVAST
ncbi:hypothetical protein FA95DRAFT_1188438 [Auriscalpium vulgare]|uniref:Uncharacterized protein n=1 Tax=Auriscalpium vulgare TaxID=40419 RepID=A0ACB8R4X3_9AGAM|nr:hypothetical protein FA95DRAFT_1188438 [Auriscalpium vulgare]